MTQRSYKVQNCGAFNRIFVQGPSAFVRDFGEGHLKAMFNDIRKDFFAGGVGEGWSIRHHLEGERLRCHVEIFLDPDRRSSVELDL